MATTLYWVAYPAAGSAPTAAQIAAGQDATGSAALASGSEPYTSPGVYDEATAITSLSAGTAYRVAWVAFDGASYSGVVVSDPITTLAAGVAGSLAAAETGSDTASFSGAVLAQAALAAAESGSDTASISASALVQAALAAAESGSDTAAITGSVVPTAGAYLAAVETGSDTASLSASAAVQAVLGAIESASDAAAASVQALIAGAMAAVETGQDVFAGVVRPASPSTGATADEIAAAVWGREIEPGITAEQMLRVIFAAVSGKTSGIGSATELYMALDGITPRITASFDAAGNRTSVTVNGT